MKYGTHVAAAAIATRVAIAAALVLTAAHATAQRNIEYIEHGYELVLEDVEIPAAAGGFLNFTPCRTCDRASLPLTAATRYALVGGRTLTFAEFAAMLTPIRSTPAAAKTGVNVFFDLRTKQVRRITVQLAE